MIFQENKPIFKQIADHIIENIIAGSKSPGDRILSVREMAADIEVNPNTVARAYAFLSELGIIYNQRGIGYFIEMKAHERATKLKTKDFLEKELPETFRKMSLLKIHIDQVLKEFQKHQP